MKISNLSMGIIALLVLSMVAFLLTTPLLWIVLFGGLGFALVSGFLTWPSGKKFMDFNIELPKGFSFGTRPKGYSAIKDRLEKLEEMKQEIDKMVAEEEESMSAEMKELRTLLDKYAGDVATNGNGSTPAKEQTQTQGHAGA